MAVSIAAWSVGTPRARDDAIRGAEGVLAAMALPDLPGVLAVARAVGAVAWVM